LHIFIILFYYVAFYFLFSLFVYIVWFFITFVFYLTFVVSISFIATRPTQPLGEINGPRVVQEEKVQGVSNPMP